MTYWRPNFNDAERRPEPPEPQGQVSRRYVLAWAFAIMLMGWLAAGLCCMMQR